MSDETSRKKIDLRALSAEREASEQREIAPEPPEKKVALFHRAVEKRFGQEVQISWVGSTLYGTQLTGETIPARAVGGRTDTARFWAVLSDEAPLDPRWKIGESQVVKLLITYDRDLRPKENTPLYDWNLGLKAEPRTHHAKLLVEFITSNAFLDAIQIHERVQNHAKAHQVVTIREPATTYLSQNSEARTAHTSHLNNPPNTGLSAEELKEHWNKALHHFDAIEAGHPPIEKRPERDAVDGLRSELDSRLTQVLEDNRLRGRNHSRDR